MTEGDRVSFGPLVGSVSPGPVKGVILDVRDGWVMVQPDDDRVSITESVCLEREDGSPLMRLVTEYRWITGPIDGLVSDLGMSLLEPTPTPNADGEK